MSKKSSELVVTDKRRIDKPVVLPKAPKVNASPLGSKVLVWRVPEDEGLIALADSAKEKPLECEVVAVSAVGMTEHDTKALSLVAPGDRVLIRKHSGSEIKVEGHELTVVSVHDVLLKL